MTKFSQMIQMPPRIVFVGWVLRPWTVLEAARLPPWWAAFWPCCLLVVTLLIRLVFFGRTSSCNWLFRWVSGSLQMIDDPDSMTEKPDAFGGRQSDFVKETLFGKGWLLTWRWIPHSIVHAIHVFDGWIYHDLPFFWPDSNCFRRQVLFRWSFGHLKSDVAFLAHFGAWVSIWQLGGTLFMCSDSDQVSLGGISIYTCTYTQSHTHTCMYLCIYNICILYYCNTIWDNVYVYFPIICLPPKPVPSLE